MSSNAPRNHQYVDTEALSGEQAKSQAQAWDSGGEASDLNHRLGPAPMLFFNLIVVFALAFVLQSTASGLQPCVHPWLVGLSLAVILLTLLHLAWPYFLRETIKAAGDATVLAVPAKAAVRLGDALHPSGLPRSLLWGMAVLIILIAIGLIACPFSPMCLSPGQTIVVRTFIVEFVGRDGPDISLRPGEVVEIRANERVKVWADISEPEMAICDWSSTNGKLETHPGCATYYIAPFATSNDAIVIRTRSRCTLQRSETSLQVIVTIDN